MGVRTDKIRALYRYMLGHTGMHGMSLDNNVISLPYPYALTVTTSRKLQNWHDNLHYKNVDGRINIHIRYDNSLENVDNAWVGVPLHDFVKLLTAHVNQTEQEGRTNAAEHRW